MADVSKIKLPNGTTYDIKDNVSGYTTNTGTITKVQTTAGAHTTINVSSGAAVFNVPTKTSHLTNDSGYITNAGVTGVKGNSESSYRTGQVNLTAANIGAISKTDELLTTNPFAPDLLKGPYISKIDNALYCANKRWSISATNISGDIGSLFDGDYEGGITINGTSTSVITFDFANGAEATGYFPGYPYGNILVNFYYVAGPSNVTGRVYCNYEPQGIGWHNITFERVTPSAEGAITYRARNSYYQISKLEISVVGDTSNSYGYTRITEIEMHLDRSNPSKTPFLSKYMAEKLYYDLTAPNFIGNLIGNVTGNVTGTATGNLTSVQYDSTNAKLTYTKNGSNTDIVTVATLKSALGSMPASDVYSWAKASSKPSYTFSEIGSKPTTLSGYGITDAKIASGVITLGSNTITPLTSSSTLSAAKLSGAIPSAVTATTQSASDNSTKIATTAFVQAAMSSAGAGTVTSVGVSNATNGGLTISGSPITSSGTITIGHSNVLTSAQTTQAVYPIKIDKNGHISAYGNAITIPSDIVSGSGSTDYLARWSNTNTLSTTSIFISTSYNSSSDSYGTIKLYVGSTGQLDWKGQLVFYSGDSSKTITITPPSLTSSRTITLPDKTGTIALTSDIPTVSYPVTSVNNKTGAVSLTASDVGALASGTTYVSTVTTTAGTHTAISSKSGAVSFNVPTKTSHLTNDSGYLTGITSSQVTTALGYTPYNSTNPNGYTSNTGTVTKVTAGTGLSIGTTAGGNFTTSGTINHTNSVTAQTTQAVYPIKIDAQGHISAYGSAVTIPTVPSNIVNTITTTAGAHTAITSQKGNVSFSIPTTAAHVGAAASDHTHGNITNGGDITATAPTIANGDQIIINDNSASKITNGPTFDGSTTTTALTPKGTWETFLKSYTETDPTVPSWAKASSKPSYNFSEIENQPTTISGYGITDAKISNGTITLGSNTITPLTGSSTLFYYDTFTASNYDFTSQQYRKLSKSITARTGYSRIIISVRCTSHSGLQVFNWSLSENTITYEVINRTSSSISGANFAMNVLYIKSSLIDS